MISLLFGHLALNISPFLEEEESISYMIKHCSPKLGLVGFAAGARLQSN